MPPPAPLALFIPCTTGINREGVRANHFSSGLGTTSRKTDYPGAPKNIFTRQATLAGKHLTQKNWHTKLAHKTETIPMQRHCPFKKASCSCQSTTIHRQVAGAIAQSRGMPVLFLFPLDKAGGNVNHGVYNQFNNTAIGQTVCLQQVIMRYHLTDLPFAV